MSENAVEYNGSCYTKEGLRKFKESQVCSTVLQGNILGGNRNIDFELDRKPIDNRTKTYTVKYAKDGIMIEGFIDGVLTDSGIVKFNRKDKLDVN